MLQRVAVFWFILYMRTEGDVRWVVWNPLEADMEAESGDLEVVTPAVQFWGTQGTVPTET